MKTKRILSALLSSFVAALPLFAAERNASAVPEGLTASDWSSIRAAYEAGRHQFFKQTDGTHVARNHSQGWQMRFDGRGFTAAPDGGGWEWGLELIHCSINRHPWPVERAPKVTVQGNRLTVARHANVEEWFVNDGRGLEQGWTIKQRPAGAGEGGSLRIELAVRSGLEAQAQAGGSEDSVNFLDASGATVLTYGGLKAWDADGKALPSRMMASSADTLAVEVQDAGARYPVTIDPIAQQAYLKPSAVGTTQGNDQFGTSVAVSGDTVVIGAPFEDNSTTGVNSAPNEAANSAGAAYVFTRSGATWTQQAYLKPATVGTSQANDQFGISVAISGNTVIVGAYLEDSNTTGVNSTPNDAGGSNFDAGAAYVFVRSGTVWTQEAYLKPAAIGTSQINDWFGFSVAVSGNTVVVGARLEDSSTTGVNSIPNESAGLAGAAYVFTRSGTTWTQQAYLKPAVVPAGTSQAGENFGASVAVSGDTVVVGAIFEASSTTGINTTPNDFGISSGAAYVFIRTGTTWTQQAYLKPKAVGSTQLNDRFGTSVAVAGDTVAIGAPFEDSSTTGINSTPNDDGSANQSGAAYVFMRFGTTWTQQAYLKPDDIGTTQANDQFGTSVAVAGDTVVVGAPLEDSSTTGINSTPNETAGSAGAAYVFTRSGTTWTQQAYLKPDAVGTTQAGDEFGNAVAIAGDTVVVGARFEDSTKTGVNSTPDDTSPTFESGAAYTFRGVGLVLPTLARTNYAAPGTADIIFGSPGFSAVNGEGEVMFDQALIGIGASGGRNRGMFSTLAQSGAVDLAFLNGTPLTGIGNEAGVGYALGSKALALAPPLLNQDTQGLFLVTATGTGVTTANNKLLLKDDGNFVSFVRRTGQPVDELVDDAVPNAFKEVLQSHNQDLIAVCHTLAIGTAGVTSANDSGLLALDHNGVFQDTTLPQTTRESNVAFGGGGAGIFGQFTGRAASGMGTMIHFGAIFVPTPPTLVTPVPVQALFFTDATGSTLGRSAKVGETPPDVAGDPDAATVKFASFPALSQLGTNGVDTLFRATLSGGDASKNQGLWRSPNIATPAEQRLLRKGDPVTNLPGVLISAITKFWPVGANQVVLQVTLTGTGVTSANNKALLLRQSDGNYLVLLRTGSPAPGAGPATVKTIQVVDVDPVNGFYAVVGSLAGATTTTNQALWAGQTTLGNDNDIPLPRQLRLPTLRLRKGEPYMSDATSLGTIKSLTIKPAVDTTGAGGRGLAQAVGSGGHAAVYILTDNGATELVLLKL